MKCININCQKEIPDNSKFCNACGTKQPEKIICPNCQTILPNDAIFCPVCRGRNGELKSEEEKLAEKVSAQGTLIKKYKQDLKNMQSGNLIYKNRIDELLVNKKRNEDEIEKLEKRVNDCKKEITSLKQQKSELEKILQKLQLNNESKDKLISTLSHQIDLLKKEIYEYKKREEEIEERERRLQHLEKGLNRWNIELEKEKKYLESIKLNLKNKISAIENLHDETDFINEKDSIIGLISSILFIPAFLITTYSLYAEEEIFISKNISFIINLNVLKFSLIFNGIVSIVLCCFTTTREFLTKLGQYRLFQSYIITIVPALITVFIRDHWDLWSDDNGWLDILILYLIGSIIYFLTHWRTRILKKKIYKLRSDFHDIRYI